MKFVDLYRSIVERKEKMSLIGLGYVGMPIAAAFAKKADVIGFDLSSAKIELYKQGRILQKKSVIWRFKVHLSVLLMMKQNFAAQSSIS